MGESCEPCPVEIDCKRVVTCAKGVYPHIEFPAPEEQGVEEVPLADVRLGRVVAVERLPPGDISDLAEDEDTLSLALGGLSYKSCTGFMIQSDLLSCWVRLNSS